MRIDGSGTKLVSPIGEYPLFNASSNRIFFQTGGYLFGSLSKSLKSVDFDGHQEMTHFTSTYANRFIPSPDNQWVAFTELYKVYISAFPPAGKPLFLSKETKGMPIAQITDRAGISLHWSADSKKLYWTQGNEYYCEKLENRFSFLRNKVDTLPPYDTQFVKINLTLQAEKPQGSIVFKNVRIITMENEGVVENGYLIIQDNKIFQVGPMSEYLSISFKADREMDLKSMTIKPGIVDVHAHLGAFRFGLSPKKHWQYWTNLAFGITTTHDPSSNSEMTFSQSEMVKTGRMVGPRIFTTGNILYGADGDFKASIDQLEDAYFAVNRTKSWGAFSVKSYNQPRRDQRQMVIKAASDLGMLVVPEGGSFFYHNMTQIADGHTGIEHNIPVYPIYKDVIQFWSHAGSGNTPTLIVNYGSVNGEYYWYQHTDVWKNERLLKFTPRQIIDARSRHRTMIPEEEYENGHILSSKSCKALDDHGVRINLGSHGQIQGLGAHWELWMLVQGGMSPLQAIKCATMNGAQYLGMEHSIGSIKNGKLADLVILSKNPLENIQHSESVQYTMINGKLWDANSMQEIYPDQTKKPSFYWNKEGAIFPQSLLNLQYSNAHCSCQHHGFGIE